MHGPVQILYLPLSHWPWAVTTLPDPQVVQTEHRKNDNFLKHSEIASVQALVPVLGRSECEGPLACPCLAPHSEVERQDQVCPGHITPIFTLTDPQSSLLSWSPHCMSSCLLDSRMWGSHRHLNTSFLPVAQAPYHAINPRSLVSSPSLTQSALSLSISRIQPPLTTLGQPPSLPGPAQLPLPLSPVSVPPTAARGRL